MRPLPLVVAAAAAIAMAGAARAASDEAFLKKALQGDNSEVQLGRIAAERGGSPEARNFGQMLVTDHGQHKMQVVPLAQAHRITDVDTAMPAANAEAAKLQGLSGRAFDHEFGRYMVRDHKADIADYRREAARAHDPAVRKLAQGTLPTLHKHLNAAERLARM